jgi:hypothetical protein
MAADPGLMKWLSRSYRWSCLEDENEKGVDDDKVTENLFSHHFDIPSEIGAVPSILHLSQVV